MSFSKPSKSFVGFGASKPSNPVRDTMPATPAFSFGSTTGIDTPVSTQTNPFLDLPKAPEVFNSTPAFSFGSNQVFESQKGTQAKRSVSSGRSDGDQASKEADVRPGDLVIYHNTIGETGHKFTAKVGGLIIEKESALAFQDVYWLVLANQELKRENAVAYASRAMLIKPKHGVGEKLSLSIGGGKLKQQVEVKSVALIEGKVQYRLVFRDVLLPLFEEELD